MGRWDRSVEDYQAEIYLGTKLSTAAVLKSHVQGVGKSTVPAIMRPIYGAHNCSTITEDELDSQFNEYMYARQFITCEEITAGGSDRQRRGDKVKHMISGPTARLNEKFMPKVEVRNVANILFCTNHPDAFNVSEHDRRLGIIECTADEPLPAKCYAEVYKLLAEGGAGRFYGHLLRQDVSDFNPHGHAPTSEAKSIMIEASRSVLGAWIHDLKTDPDAVVIHAHSIHRKLLSLHTADELLTMFDGGLGRSTTKAMALALRSEAFKMANDGEQIRLGDDIKRRLWITRNASSITRMSLSQIASLYHRERSSRSQVNKFDVLKGGKQQQK